MTYNSSKSILTNQTLIFFFKQKKMNRIKIIILIIIKKIPKNLKKKKKKKNGIDSIQPIITTYFILSQYIMGEFLSREFIYICKNNRYMFHI